MELCLNARGFRPVVATIYPGARLRPALDEAAVAVHELGVARKYGFMEAARRLARLVRSVQPDLVHSMLYRSGVIARLALWRTRIPLVHSLVSEPFSSIQAPVRLRARLALPALKLFDRVTAVRVDRFLANSRALAQGAVRLGATAQAVAVIYRGRDPRRFEFGPELRAATREELGLAGGDLMILNVGRLRPPKAQLLLVDAFASLGRRLPRARLFIAGEGPLRTALETRIRELGLGASIQLLGGRSDVPALLAAADIFAFPSDVEGHPGALVEAMLAARPIVASDIAPHRETLLHGSTGLLFAKGDAAELEKALTRLATDESLRAELGVRARADATLRFSTRAMVEAHLAEYRKLVVEGPGAQDCPASSS